MLTLTIATGALIALATAASAAPAYPFEHTFEQSDGSTVTLTRWGDEFANGWETHAGFSAVRNDRSGNWEYARRARDGSLEPSGRVVGRDAAPGQRHLRPSPAAYSQAQADFHGSEGASSPAAQASAGTTTAAAPAWVGPDTDVLFLAVEFADRPCSFSITQHQANMFGGAASGPGDLDDYYREISYGALEIDGVVVGDDADGCISLADDHAVYDTGSKDAKDVVAEAVAAADAYTDFSQFDNDGDGTVDALGIIYAGGGPHDGCDTDDGAGGGGGDNLWPHSSGTGGTATADGVTVNPYIINSEVTFAISGGGCTVIQTVGLFAHEFGHSLGIPDLYDTDGSSEGVGFWSTMASQYRSTVNLADTPPHFDPWSKWILGWVAPTDHTSYEGNGPIQQVATTGEVIQLGENPGGPEIGGTGEYWLVENRQLVGFDSALPGCGLVVWHIEESMTHNKNEGHTTASHRLVDVEEADGLDHLDANDTNRGDDGDPFPGSSDNRLFDDVSNPTANYYDGSPSGFRIADISDCGPVMSANFGNPAADVRVSKAVDRIEVPAGEDLRYTITVTNDGPATASNVTVTDTLPDGVTLVGGPTYCAEAAGVVTCDLGQKFAGQSSTFHLLVTVDPDLVASGTGTTAYLTNVVEVSADQADDDLTNNIDTADTIVVEEADLAMAKTCKPDVVADAGATAFCELTVVNHGPSTARDVEVRDDIVSLVDVTLGTLPSGCADATTSNGHRVTCDIGDLDPGETVTRTIEFTTDEGGDVNDTARVSSPTDDPDPSDDAANGRVSFRPVADLALTKTESPDPVVAGETLVYTLTATNTGPSTAANVEVVDQLPSEVEVLAVTASPSGSCSTGVPGDAARPTGCTFGALADGDAVTVTIEVLVSPDATGVLTNDGWVRSDAFDPDNADDVASTVTSVETLANLQVEKVSSPSPVVAGEVLHHTITVRNVGPSTAREVHVEDALPAGTTYQAATLSVAGSCALVEVPPDTLTCDVAELGVGEEFQLYVDTLVDPSVPHDTLVENTVTVSSATPEASAGNNTATAFALVTTVADVSVSKEGTFDTSSSSSTVEYVVTVANAGPSDAQDVVVVDTLPSIQTKGGKEKVEFVHATDGCTYDASTHSVTCDVGTLADGATYEARIYIQVSGNAKLVNDVDVTSTTVDPDAGNNHDRHQITVQGGSNRRGGPKK